MNRLKSFLLKILYAYGKKGAFRPSHHGTYEAKVPQCLYNDICGKK